MLLFPRLKLFLSLKFEFFDGVGHLLLQTFVEHLDCFCELFFVEVSRSYALLYLCFQLDIGVVHVEECHCLLADLDGFVIFLCLELNGRNVREVNWVGGVHLERFLLLLECILQFSGLLQRSAFLLELSSLGLFR